MEARPQSVPRLPWLVEQADPSWPMAFALCTMIRVVPSRQSSGDHCFASPEDRIGPPGAGFDGYVVLTRLSLVADRELNCKDGKR